MNERIIELADKAIDDMPGAWNIPDDFCEKFAELIIKDFKSVILDMMNNGQGEFDTLDQVLTEINERLGVEE